MFRNKYIIGAAAGATSLAIAFPLVAQLASAATTTDGTTSSRFANRPTPSQACVQAIADKDAAFLANVDTFIAAHKAAVQAHKNALTAAAALTDETQRKAAVDAAEEAFRAAMKAASDAQQTALKSSIDAVKTACGNAGFGMGGFGGPMMDGRGPMKKGGGFHMMNKGGHGRGQPFGSSSQDQ